MPITKAEAQGVRTTDAIRKWESSAPGAKQQGDLACWHLALLLLGEIPLPEVAQLKAERGPPGND